MTNETWHIWKPVNNLKKDYFIKSISDYVDKLEIELIGCHGNNQKITFTFKSGIECYQKIDEGSRLLLFEEFCKKYPSDAYTQWSFFIRKNSFLLDKIIAEKPNISESSKLIHFCFFTYDFVIDVIAQDNPTTLIEKHYEK